MSLDVREPKDPVVLPKGIGQLELPEPLAITPVRTGGPTYARLTLGVWYSLFTLSLFHSLSLSRSNLRALLSQGPLSYLVSRGRETCLPELLFRSRGNRARAGILPLLYTHRDGKNLNKTTYEPDTQFYCGGSSAARFDPGWAAAARGQPTSGITGKDRCWGDQRPRGHGVCPGRRWGLDFVLRVPRRAGV